MATRSYATVARQYARDVVAKKILTCKWVRLACQRQLDDLERFKGKDSAYRFNPKLTQAATANNKQALINMKPEDPDNWADKGQQVLALAFDETQGDA